MFRYDEQLKIVILLALYVKTSWLKCQLFYTDSMVKVLSSGGSVLLPVDTAGRVLELLLTMEQVTS